ncbi:MAG: DUF2794 domain-containing protein [Pseudomonadota bacterium]
MANTPQLSLVSSNTKSARVRQTCFNRFELQAILDVYARMVTYGEWKDYSLDIRSDHAAFNIYRRASEMPVYSIVKEPSLARKQGAYRLVSQSQQVLKRGQELSQVLAPLRKQLLKVIDSQ